MLHRWHRVRTLQSAIVRFWLVGALILPTLAQAPVARASTPTQGLGDQRFYRMEQRRLWGTGEVKVNVASGNLLLHQNLFRIHGTAGFDLNLDLYYNGLGADAGRALGSRWMLNYGQDVFLEFVTGGVINVHGPSGYINSYTPNGNGGGYITPGGADADLTHNGDGTYTLTVQRTSQKYTFTSSGALSQQADKNSNRISLAYNGNGTLASITDTQGRIVSFAYNGGTPNLLASIRDSTGRAWTFGYTTRPGTHTTDLLLRASGPVGTLTYNYESGNRLSSINHPVGDGGADITGLAWDASNRISNVTLPGTPAIGFTYNSGSTVVQDENANSTTYAYDSQGRVTQTTDALGHNTQATYTSNSNVQQSTDPFGKVSIFAYDTKNNLTSAQGPAGALTSWRYDDAAHAFSATSVTDPQGNSVTFAYDPSGNLTDIQNGLQSQNRTHIAYNPNGTVQSTTGANGDVTSYGYDALGNLTGITRPSPLGSEIFTYDSLSRITGHTDGKNQHTTYASNSRDQITAVTYADGGSVNYAWSSSGTLHTMRDSTGLGQVTLGHDSRNRLTTENLQVAPNGSFSTVWFSYDNAGNLTALNDPNTGGVSYTYNAVNSVSQISSPSGTMQFQYDNGNRRTQTTYPGGTALTQAYDASGRLTGIVGKDGTGTVVSSFGYGFASQTGSDSSVRTTMTDKDGNVTRYTYDALNRLLEAQTRNGAGAVIGDYQYVYDGNGNRTSQTANGTPTTYAYNAANELTTGGGLAYTYDGNGSLTGRSDGLAISYDARDHATSMTPPAGSAVTMKYLGDPQTARSLVGGLTEVNTALGVTSTAAAPGNSTGYTRDNAGLLLAEKLPDGTSYYYLYDGQGNAVALTDSAGHVSNTYQYSPYGETVSTTGSVANPYRFGGSYGAYTDSTGLLKIGQRFDDPKVGRWTQQDPLVHLSDAALWNRYAYVADNPTNLSDPGGEQPYISGPDGQVIDVSNPHPGMQESLGDPLTAPGIQPLMPEEELAGGLLLRIVVGIAEILT